MTFTIFHAEEKVYFIHNEIDINSTYRVTEELIDVADKGKGKGAVLMERINSYKLDKEGKEDLAYFI